MPPDYINNSIETVEENNYICLPRLFPELFTREECGRIIKLSENFPIKESKIVSGGAYGNVDLYTRSSKYRWMDPVQETAWVFEKIQEAISYVNQYYRFELLGCRGAQVTQYPVGGHYNWHSDIGKGATSKRKLSITVQLSDSASYEGGDLEFIEGNFSLGGEHRQQGTATIFPSYLRHRVSIVTKGVRWALVVWFLGPPFR